MVLGCDVGWESVYEEEGYVKACAKVDGCVAQYFLLFPCLLAGGLAPFLPLFFLSFCWSQRRTYDKRHLLLTLLSTHPPYPFLLLRSPLPLPHLPPASSSLAGLLLH